MDGKDNLENLQNLENLENLENLVSGDGFTFTGLVLDVVARRADAPVGTIQILTGPWTTSPRIHCTLIDICGREITQEYIFTLWKRKDPERYRGTREEGGVNMLLTNTYPSISSEFVSIAAVADEGADAVDTVSIPTQASLSGALVRI